MTIRNEDILSYNPDLDIKVKPNVEASVNENDDYRVSDFKSNRSVTLDEFELNKPSSKIKMLVDLENDIEKYKKALEEKMADNITAMSYFRSETIEDKNEILSENSNDMINGITTLESYIALDSMKEEVSMVKDSFIVSIYGKDIDVDKIEEIDDEYINKMDSYEFNDKHEYINYFNLYYDTQISYLIGEYTYKMSNVALELSYINDGEYNSKADKNSEKILKNSFDKTNKLLDFDLNKNNDSFEQLRTAIKNVFITKQELNMYYDFLYSLDNIGEELEVVYDIRKENVDNLNEKIESLVKSVMLSELCKKDIHTTLDKKSKIRGFFIM